MVHSCGTSFIRCVTDTFNHKIEILNISSFNEIEIFLARDHETRQCFYDIILVCSCQAVVLPGLLSQNNVHPCHIYLHSAAYISPG